MEATILIAPFESALYRAMIALRHEVLRRPLGLAYAPEQLAAERDQIHLALLADERVAGTLLLMPPDSGGQAKLRQMAIDPAYERRGLGNRLMARGEQELHAMKTRRIVLHARESAIGFYERLGYETIGEPFTEVTLPHRRMVKDLS